MSAKVKKKTQKKISPKKASATPLRRRAEKKLAGSKKKLLPFKADPQELSHELQVHQIELEMQNEELRRAQEELTTSQQKYIDLYDFAPAGHFTFNKMGKVIEANLCGARMLGVERANLLRCVFSEFVAPEYRDVFRIHRAQVLQNCSAQDCELKLIRKDGSSFYAVARSEGVEGKPDLIRSAFLDITGLKEAQEQTKEEHRFREAIESSLISGIAAVDLEGRQTYVNPAFCRMVGWSREELLGSTPPFVYWPPEDTENIGKIFAQIFSSGKTSGSIELRFQRRNGERFDALVLYSVLKDRRGNNIGWIGSYGDITESKKRALEIQRLNRELEERVRQRTAELQKANVLLDSIFESAPIGLGFWDKDLRFVRLNKSLAEINGLPVADHIGKTIAEVIPNPRVARKMEADWKRVIQTGQPMSNIEVSGETYAHSGERRHWVNNRYPVRVGNEIIGIAATVLDITERKRAEEALREGQQDLDRAQEVGQIGSWRLDVRRNVLMWSDETYRIFGIPKGTSLTYETFLGSVYPDDRQYVDMKWQAGLRGEPYDIEHRILVGRQVKWVREKAYLEFDDEGKLLGGFGISQDITERKQAEEAIKESEEKYRSLFCSMSEGFGLHEIILDADGKPCDYRFLELNDAFEKLTGISRTKALGRRVREVLPDIESYWIETYGRVALSGEPVHYENYSAPLGKWYGVYSYSPRKNHFAVIFMDITERKQVEEEIRALNKALTGKAYALELANKELEAFASTLAHDFKNQLIIIATFVGRLLTGQAKNLDIKGQEYLRFLNESVGKMFALVDDVLTLSRVASRRIRPEKVNMSVLAGSILKKYQEKDSDRQVQLVLEKGMEIEGDRGLLEAMLENLLGNAWKFTKNSESARIEFGVRWENGDSVFYVRDNGCGFEMPEDPDKVFLPFQRFHSEDEYPGSGMGLATVKKILDRHGGRIWVESNVGKGTTFYFSCGDNNLIK